MPLKQVISGGQTGADQAGVRAAKVHGLPTGGHMPPGFKTEGGPRPEFAGLFGMVETPGDYPERTRENVQVSDGTIRFAANWKSPGEQCTLKAIREFQKPSIDVDIHEPIPVERVIAWIGENNIRVLNVAGNAQPAGTKTQSYLVTRFTLDYLGRVFTSLGLTRDAGEEARLAAHFPETTGDSARRPRPARAVTAKSEAPATAWPATPCSGDDIGFKGTKGEFGWLGNFSAHPVVYRGRRWRTTEALFQSLRFNRVLEADFIRRLWLCDNPRTCAREARQRFDFLVNEVRHPHLAFTERLCPGDIDNMRTVIRLKLAQHPALRRQLLDSGERRIFEDVTGRGERHYQWGAARKGRNWIGNNRLGEMWMELRIQLRDGLLDLNPYGIRSQGGHVFDARVLDGDPILIRDGEDAWGQFARGTRGEITWAGATWPSGEHLFQALRFREDRTDLREQIRQGGTIRQAVDLAKRLRRGNPDAHAHASHTEVALKGETAAFQDLAMGETGYRYGLLGEEDLESMKIVLCLKAAQLPGLRTLLERSSERPLIYDRTGGNPRQLGHRSIRFWGMTRDARQRWRGLNWLGELLVEIRPDPTALDGFGVRAQSR